MECRPFRFRQRRTSISGRKPAITGLYDGEIYLNTFDGAIYFKDKTCQNLFKVITDSSGNGLNDIKFNGAQINDVPFFNGSGFTACSLTGFLSGYLTGYSSFSGDSSNFVTTGQTGDFVTTGQTGQFVTTGQTGNFVTTGQTGNFVTTGQTGNFVTTGQTGNFVTTGQTGNFVTTGQTGSFVTADQIGDFGYSIFTTGEIGYINQSEVITGLRYFNSNVSDNWFCNNAWFLDSSLNYYANDLPYNFTRVKICNNNSVCINLDNPLWVQPKSIDSSEILNQVGICLYSHSGNTFSGTITGDFSLYDLAIFSGKIGQEDFNQITCLSISSNSQVITGLRYFDSSVSSDWFCSNAWFLDSYLNNQANDLPYDFTRVKIRNNNSICINLDNPLWVQPKSIDSSEILNQIGVCLYSHSGNIFSGTITGDFSLYDSAIFSGKIGQEDFNEITCCLITGSNSNVSYGQCSYLIKNSGNVLRSSSYSIILNGTGNTLNSTQNSAIIGSCITVNCGQSDTLYVKNICLVNSGKIYGDGSELININGGGSGSCGENPFHSAVSICCYAVTNNNTPISLNIHELELNQSVFFSASVMGQGYNEFVSHKIEGMVRRQSQQCEDILLCNSIKFNNSPSKSIFSKSNCFLDVNVIVNKICGTLDLQIIGDSSDSMEWFSKIDLLKIIKQ